jgi:predicted DNA-binding transcriptional regulator YafY
MEILVRLQLSGSVSATELADSLEVSVRTIYRDVESLASAGVPIYTEVGRNGGIRIDPAYRVGGLPRVSEDEARSLLFSAVPGIGEQLGFDAGAADRTLLPALEPATETAAKVVRDRLLIEPTHWFIQPDDAPALPDVARAVWDARELRLRYRDADVVVQPLGLILKGYTWYLIGHVRRSAKGSTRLYRISRIESVEVLDHRFERPSGFDLVGAWASQQASFRASMPEYFATVRVSPAGEALLGLLDEASPPLPLSEDTPRDRRGWAELRLRFERSEVGVARHLLRLGAEVEVIEPPELRERMVSVAKELNRLYRAR